MGNSRRAAQKHNCQVHAITFAVAADTCFAKAGCLTLPSCTCNVISRSKSHLCHVLPMRRHMLYASRRAVQSRQEEPHAMVMSTRRKMIGCHLTVHQWHASKYKRAGASACPHKINSRFCRPALERGGGGGGGQPNHWLDRAKQQQTLSLPYS